MSFIFNVIVQLSSGIPLTLQLMAVSTIIGGILGVLIAFARVSKWSILSLSAWLYIQIVRSMPLLVVLFLVYYGLSQFSEIRHSLLWPFLKQPYWCAIIALAINTSGFTAEIVRGGILSIGKNEIEAAQAYGMSKFLILRRITLPLAVRQALPAYSNEVISMVKATSLASLITLMEITGIAYQIVAQTYRPISVFIAAGIIYLTINFLLTTSIKLIEYHITPHFRRPVTSTIFNIRIK